MKALENLQYMNFMVQITMVIQEINLKVEKIYQTSLCFRKHITLSIRGFKSFLKDQIEYKSNKYVNRSDNLELNNLELILN